MSRINVVFYTDDGIKAKVLDWIHFLPIKAQYKCTTWIDLLAERGHNLRRPHADYLSDGIYELRIVSSGNQYRILYFFHGKKAVVLTCGFIKKQDKVPKVEIHRAKAFKVKFEANPKFHTYVEEVEEEL